MNVTQITFNRHVNTGNYESFEMQATVAVPDTGDADKAAAFVQGFVDELCNQRLNGARRPGRRGGMDAGELGEPFDG